METISPIYLCKSVLQNLTIIHRCVFFVPSHGRNMKISTMMQYFSLEFQTALLPQTDLVALEITSHLSISMHSLGIAIFLQTGKNTVRIPRSIHFASVVLVSFLMVSSFSFISEFSQRNPQKNSWINSYFSS